MVKPNSTLPKDSQESDSRFNPSQQDYERRFDGSFDPTKPKQDGSATPDGSHESLPPAEQADTDQRIADIAAGLRAQEEGGDFSQTATTTGGEPRGRWQRFKGNRKAVKTLGISGGIGAVLIAGFFAMLPLKMEMLIKSVEQQVNQHAEDAITQRTQYLTSMYLAHRVMNTANPADTYPGTPAQTLYKTWFANKYERELGIKIESEGRTSNRQKATKWTITFANGESISGGELSKGDLIQRINSSKEMHRFIRTEAREKTKPLQFYKRYAMRKTLMRTKGVTKWAWLPEKVVDKTDRKNALKASLREDLYHGPKLAVTRSGAHLACFFDTKSCKDLVRKGFDTKLPAEYEEEVCAGKKNPKTCEARNELRRETRDKLNSAIASTGGEIDDIIDKAADGDDPSKEVQRLLTRQILSKVLGGAAIVDMLARTTVAIDEGAINQILYDRNSIATANISRAVMTGNDQWKAGELDGDQLNVMLETLNGYGANPAWQELIGVRKKGDGRVERLCRDDDGKVVEVTLPKGQSVCDDKMIINDSTSFTNNPVWEVLAEVSRALNSTVGKVFDVIFSITDKIMDLTGMNLLIETIVEKTGVGRLAAGMIEKFLGFLFGMPYTGDDKGAELADGVIGGLSSSAFALGEASLDFNPGDGEIATEKNGLGIGGAIMSPTQVTAAKSRIAEQRSEINAQRPLMAKLFDTNSANSFVSQLAIRTPTSFGEVKSFSTVLGSSISSIFTPDSSAAASIKNPFFSVDIAYGYADSKKLRLDPAMMTEEQCIEWEEERQDSYKPPSETGYPIYVYTKSNPCALEKVVAASNQGFLTTKYPEQFELIGDQNSSSNDGDSGGVIDGVAWPVDAKYWDTHKNLFLAPHTANSGNFTGGTNGVAIDWTMPGSADCGVPVYSMFDGRVEKSPIGGSGGNGVIIESTVNGKKVRVAYAHGEKNTSKSTVSAGEQIMVIGTSGNSSGCHLHLDMSYDGASVCPQDIFVSLGKGESPDLGAIASKSSPPCGGRGYGVVR